MGSRIRLALVAVLLLLTCSAPGAQQPQAPPPADAAAGATAPQGTQPPQPTFRTGINFVRVDVIVSDRNGNPVADLQPGDFEVLEDDRPQKIDTFKMIELDGGLLAATDTPPRQIRTDADEETEAARDDVRLFGIFLDDYHVRRLTSMSARQSLARFVETQLGPTDMVAVMYPLEPIAAVRFTRNHDAIGRALLQFDGRKFDYEPRNELEVKYAHYPTEVVERIRNEVSLSAIKGLISRMGGLKEGRKSLILISEGYSNMLPPQMRNPNAQLPGFGNPARGNPTAGQDDPNEFRAMAMSSFDMELQLREVYDMANRNNVAIYAVDPRGLSTGEFDIQDNISSRIDRDYLMTTMNTLRTLSTETDGRPIVNRNDLTIAMKQIMRDSSAYYLIGYSSSVAKPDGKFHEIKVRVKRPGVQVRARKGYWAMTREEAIRSTTAPKVEPPSAVSTAIAAIAQPARSRLIRTWIGTERGDDGKTRVTFVWEPSPRVPGAAARSGETPARVSLTAAGPDGAPVFRGRVPESVPAAPASAASAGSRITFDVPPGALQLKIAVEGAAAEVLDSESRQVTIPDMTAPQTFLGTPQIFRARTQRDLQQLKADPQPLPTAAREFSRTERLLIRVNGYGPGITKPTITARLLNRSGQPMAPVQVGQGPGGGSEIDLPLAGLAVGEYVLELNAAGDAGASQELVAFRITG